MKLLNHASMLVCSHGGRVVLPAAEKPSLYIDDEPALLDRHLEGAPILGCGQHGPGLRPCSQVVTVLAGRAQVTSSSDGLPLDETLIALTNGNPPGQCRLAGPAPGSLEEAFVAGTSTDPESCSPAAGEATFDGDAAASAVQSSAVRVRVVVDMSEVDAAGWGLPRESWLRLVFAYGKNSTTRELFVPLDGSALELTIAVPSADEFWYTATSHPHRSSVEALKPLGCEAPFVAVDERSVTVSEHAERWSPTYSDMLRKIDAPLGWRQLALVNELPADDPRKLPAWALVHVPLYKAPGVDLVEIRLVPAYPKLWSAKCAALALKAKLEPPASDAKDASGKRVVGWEGRLGNADLQQRLELAVLCEHLDRTDLGGAFGLPWALLEQRYGPRVETSTPLHELLLGEFHRARVAAAEEIIGPACELMDRVGPAGAVDEELRNEHMSLLQVSPMHLGLCLPLDTRSDQLGAFIKESAGNEATVVLQEVLDTLRRVARLLAGLEARGRPMPEGEGGLFGDERSRWRTWFHDILTEPLRSPVDEGCLRPFGNWSLMERICGLGAGVLDVLHNAAKPFVESEVSAIWVAGHSPAFFVENGFFLRLRKRTVLLAGYLDLNTGSMALVELEKTSDLFVFGGTGRTLNAQRMSRGRRIQAGRSAFHALALIFLFYKLARSRDPEEELALDRMGGDLVAAGIETVSVVAAGRRANMLARLAKVANSPRAAESLGQMERLLRRAAKAETVGKFAGRLIISLEILDTMRGLAKRDWLMASAGFLGVTLGIGAVAGASWPFLLGGLFVQFAASMIPRRSELEQQLVDILARTEFGTDGHYIDGHPFHGRIESSASFKADYLDWRPSVCARSLGEVQGMLVACSARSHQARVDLYSLLPSDVRSSGAFPWRSGANATALEINLLSLPTRSARLVVDIRGGLRARLVVAVHGRGERGGRVTVASESASLVGAENRAAATQALEPESLPTTVALKFEDDREALLVFPPLDGEDFCIRADTSRADDVLLLIVAYPTPATSRDATWTASWSACIRPEHAASKRAIEEGPSESYSVKGARLIREERPEPPTLFESILRSTSDSRSNHGTTPSA